MAVPYTRGRETSGRSRLFANASPAAAESLQDKLRAGVYGVLQAW